MNCLQPPNDKNTVKIISGLSGSSSKWNSLPLNNLNDLWIKNLENLQSGDIMICGGDFIEAASPDACFLGKNQKDPTGSLTVTAEKAASWKVNADYDKVCSTTEELNSCEYGAYQDEAGNTRPGTFQCICPCKDGKMSTYASNLDLLSACKSAMARGVKIVFMDDMFFLSDVYADNKRMHDLVFVTLQHYSDTLDPTKQECRGGGFYWYMYGQQGRSKLNGSFLKTHAKVTSFYFIGPSHKDKYFSSIQGSFNPSYPLSLTFEIGVNVLGLLENEFIKASAYFPFDELTHVISFAYTSDPSLGPRRYYTGLGPVPCPPSSEWTPNNTTPNHCNIPPCCKGEHHGFLQPWFNIANTLGISGFNPTSGDPGQPPPPASWWTSLKGTIWASDDASTTGYYPVFGNDVFNKPITIPTVEFCGLDFTKIKYGKSINENRVTFTDSNVVVKFGAAPTQLMGRYYYGLTLLSELLGDADKYVKVGLMQNFLDYPCVGEGCGSATKDSTDIIDKLAGTWLLGPSTKLPTRTTIGTTYNPGQMLKLFNKGVPLYIFQKLQPWMKKPDPKPSNWPVSSMCAFTCDSSSGTCQTSPPDPTKSFPDQSSCFDAFGKVTTGSNCYDNASACEKACTKKESYMKDPECSGTDNQAWVSSWTRGFNELGISPDGDMIIPWLQGRSTLNGIPVKQLGANYVGEKGPRSKLETGSLASVSSDNPYPLFVGWYSQNKKKTSGLHWKFYMNEKSMLLSTQHPISTFYTSGDAQGQDPSGIYTDTYTAMGYDIQWGNCPNMIAYYDQLYNWIWENSVLQFEGLAPPTSLAKNLIPPLCSTSGCKIPGAKPVGGDGSCYKGGKGARQPAPPSGKPPWKKIALGIGITLLILAIGTGVWLVIKSQRRGAAVVPEHSTGSKSLWNRIHASFQSFKGKGGLKYSAIAIAAVLLISLIIVAIVSLLKKSSSPKGYLMRIYPVMSKDASEEDYDKLFDSLGQYLQCCQTNNTYLDDKGNLLGDAITGPSGEAPNKMRYIGGIERFGPDDDPQSGNPFYPPIWKGFPCCQGDYKIPRMPKGKFVDWYALQYFNVPVIDVNDKGWDFEGRSKPANRSGFRSISTLGSTSPGTNLFGTVGQSKGKQALITPSDPTATNQGIPYGQVAGPGAVYAGSSFFCRAGFSPNGPQFDPDLKAWTLSGMKNDGKNWLNQYMTLDSMKHAIDFSNKKPWFNGFKEGEHLEIGHTQRVPGLPNSTGYWANYFGGGRNRSIPKSREDCCGECRSGG